MKIKNIIIGALVAASLTAVSAQNYKGQGADGYASGFKSIPAPKSNKKATTSGRFSTDVDNYMGVNDWSKLKDMEKCFGFLGYNYIGGSAFNMGFAKFAKETYVGMYFGGQLDGMKMTSTFTDVDGAANSYEYEATSNNSYTASVLVGTKKGLGVKTSMFYKPTTSGGKKSSYSKPDLEEKEFDQIDLYDLYFDVAVGLGDKKSTHFNVGLDSNVAKATNQNGFQDNSYFDLYLGGGLTTEKKGWDLDLDTRWRITPITYKHSNDMDYDHFGKSDNVVRFKAAKGYTLDATDKLRMKAKVSIPVYFGVKTNDDDAVRVDGDDWIYSDSRTHNINLGTNPTLDLGAVYQIKPKKVDLNVGTNIAFGDIGWNWVVTTTRKDTDSASIDNTTTEMSFGFDSRALTVAWTSGFTVYLGKAVTLDANYNIVGNLFNGFSNNNDTFDRDNEITETINKVLIPTGGLSFILSMKL